MPNLNKIAFPSDDQFFEAKTYQDEPTPLLRAKVETYRKGTTLTLSLERSALKMLNEHVIGAAQLEFAQDNENVFIRVTRNEDAFGECEWTVNPFSRSAENKPYYFVKREMLNFPIKQFSGGVNFEAIEGGLLVVIPKSKASLSAKPSPFHTVPVISDKVDEIADMVSRRFKSLPDRALSPLIRPVPIGLIPDPLSKVSLGDEGVPIWTIDADQWLLAYMTQGGELACAASKLGVPVLEITARYASLYRLKCLSKMEGVAS